MRCRCLRALFTGFLKNPLFIVSGGNPYHIVLVRGRNLLSLRIPGIKDVGDGLYFFGGKCEIMQIRLVDIIYIFFFQFIAE